MRKRTIKKFLLGTTIITSLCAMNAYAVGPGMYMGLMFGPATNDGSEQRAQVLNSPTTVLATPKSNQFASRVFAGYQMNKYVAVETGITYIPSVNFTTKNDVPTCGSTSMRVRDVEVLGKGIIPFGNYFDIFGKAGVAYVYQSQGGALNPDLNSDCGKTKYTSKFAPAISFGASYNLSQSWVADVSVNRIMVGGILKNITTLAIGLSYHIVDRYCGQFLCDD